MIVTLFIKLVQVRLFYFVDQFFFINIMSGTLYQI